MTIAQQVESILKHVPKTRDSDKELMIVYMRKFGLELTPKQEELFREMPTAETLTRVRRKLQEDGKYQASAEVRAERDFKSMQMQQITPKANAHYVDVTMDGRQVLPWGE